MRKVWVVTAKPEAIAAGPWVTEMFEEDEDLLRVEIHEGRLGVFWDNGTEKFAIACFEKGVWKYWRS